MTEQRFDLVVRNSTIVTPGHREQADVGITGGRIVRRGQTVLADGQCTARPGQGQWVRRDPADPAQRAPDPGLAPGPALGKRGD